MWKKISIQLILLSIVFFSIFYVYKFYFTTKDSIKINQSDIVQNKSSEDITNNKSNFDIGAPSKRYFKNEVMKYSYMWREGGQFSKNKYDLIN